MEFLLPKAFSFRVNFFTADKLLDDHDLVFATLYIDDVKYPASLHYPKGKLVKGDLYDGKAGAWIKGMYKGNLQIVLNKKDPAAGLDYATAGKAKKLPV